MLLKISIPLFISALGFGHDEPPLITNKRIRVTTKKYCNNAIKDRTGQRVPCTVSAEPHTKGLTKPGMDDGYLTTYDDIIATSGGQVSVKAVPNHPYQYFLQVDSPGYSRTEHLFNNRAFIVKEALGDDSTPGVCSGEDSCSAGGGWVQRGVYHEDGATTIKWSTKGPEGVDPDTGFNFSMLYEAGLAPDTWFYFTDRSSGSPKQLHAVNSLKGNRLFQESTLEVVEDLNPAINVDDATRTMYETYQINTGRVLSADWSRGAPPLDPHFVSEDYLPESARSYFENASPSSFDWLKSNRKLGQGGGGGGAFKGIPYFTIEKGTAAYQFFHAKSNRALQELMKYEYPDGCSTTKGTQEEKYCLSISMDTGSSSISLSCGMAFIDIEDSSKSSRLKLGVQFSVSDDSLISMLVEADGSAKVFSYGEDNKLDITVSFTGDDPAKKLPDGSWVGAASMKVHFHLHLSVVGDLIDSDINGRVNFTSTSGNDIQGIGSAVANASALVAGAGVYVNLKVNTLEHTFHKWEFISTAGVDAWVGLGSFKKDWKNQWELWKQGPISV